MQQVARAIAPKVPGWAAKHLIKGFMQRLSHDWTLEWFQECAARDADVSNMVDAPEWYAKLLEMLDAHPSLRNTKLTEIIGWVKEEAGNPALVEQILPDPKVMKWLTRAWGNFMRDPSG